MPLPRMTTRRWMVAVIGIAVALALAAEFNRVWRVSEHYAWVSRRHHEQELEAERNRALFAVGIARRVKEAEWAAQTAGAPGLEARDALVIESNARRAKEWVRAWRNREQELAAEARYHATMRRKYRYAARYPWLPVPPDPPRPE